MKPIRNIGNRGSKPGSGGMQPNRARSRGKLSRGIGVAGNFDSTPCIDCLGTGLMVGADGTSCYDMMGNYQGVACTDAMAPSDSSRGVVDTTEPVTAPYGDCSPWECPDDWHCFIPSLNSFECSENTSQIDCLIDADLGANCYWTTQQWDSWSGGFSDAGNGGVCMCGNTLFSPGDNSCCRGWMHNDFVTGTMNCGCTDCNGVNCCNNDGLSYADYWVGDGICDDGTDNGWPMDNGSFANFNCAEFYYDGGDCIEYSSNTCHGNCPQGGCNCDGWENSYSYDELCDMRWPCVCTDDSDRCGNHVCIGQGILC